MRYIYVYVILGICAVAISIGKVLAVNFGISKYLSKKPYNSKFKTIKTASVSFAVEYILLAITALFLVVLIMNVIYSHIRFDELLQDFLYIYSGAIMGANYRYFDYYVIPYIFFIIVSVVVLFFVNYKFIYKDFEVSKKKKLKLSFFTALANAPYEFLIPYGQFGSMIIYNMI